MIRGGFTGIWRSVAALRERSADGQTVAPGAELGQLALGGIVMARPWVVALLSMFTGLCSADAPRAQAVNPVRTLLASGRMGSVNQLPLYFRLLAVHLKAAERMSYNGSASMLYALSGRANVVIDGTAQPLGEGE